MLANATTGITNGCGTTCTDCTGTALPDGTYVMTAWAPATMSSGCNMDDDLDDGNIVVGGGIIQYVIDANNGAPFGTLEHYEGRGTFTIDAGTLHVTSVCGAANVDLPFGSNASGDLLFGQGQFTRQ